MSLLGLRAPARPCHHRSHRYTKGLGAPCTPAGPTPGGRAGALYVPAEGPVPRGRVSGLVPPRLQLSYLTLAQRWTAVNAELFVCKTGTVAFQLTTQGYRAKQSKQLQSTTQDEATARRGLLKRRGAWPGACGQPVPPCCHGPRQTLTVTAEPDASAPALRAGGGHTCTPVRADLPPAPRNHSLSVPAPSCTQWSLMPGFLCQIRTANSFLSFNVINHPTFSSSELRNLHFYNGGFENKDTNANDPRTARGRSESCQSQPSTLH